MLLICVKTFIELHQLSLLFLYNAQTMPKKIFCILLIIKELLISMLICIITKVRDFMKVRDNLTKIRGTVK